MSEHEGSQKGEENEPRGGSVGDAVSKEQLEEIQDEQAGVETAVEENTEEVPADATGEEGEEGAKTPPQAEEEDPGDPEQAPDEENDEDGQKRSSVEGQEDVEGDVAEGEDGEGVVEESTDVADKPEEDDGPQATRSDESESLRVKEEEDKEEVKFVPHEEDKEIEVSNDVKDSVLDIFDDVPIDDSEPPAKRFEPPIDEDTLGELPTFGGKYDMDGSDGFDRFTLRESMSMTREDLLNKYQDAKTTHLQLSQQNNFVQNKLCDKFKTTRGSADHQLKGTLDPDQQFNKLVAEYKELDKTYVKERERAIVQLQMIKELSTIKKHKADMERMKFLEYKKQVALNSVGRQSGKPVPPKDVEMAVVREELKDHDLVQMRLEHLKLLYKMRRQQQELQKREEFASGLHLFDFELLKIENETCNEKIEERNEELHKLRKKNASTVQILAHLKEKLKSVQSDNLAKKETLKESDESLTKSRQILSRTKHVRDVHRKDNKSLRFKSGLMGHQGLLRDLETSVDEKTELLIKLENLKVKHEHILQSLERIKATINNARQASIRAYSISVVRPLHKASSSSIVTKSSSRF